MYGAACGSNGHGPGGGTEGCGLLAWVAEGATDGQGIEIFGNIVFFSPGYRNKIPIGLLNTRWPPFAQYVTWREKSALITRWTQCPGRGHLLEDPRWVWPHAALVLCTVAAAERLSVPGA
jgi:hypothetical protein